MAEQRASRAQSRWPPGMDPLTAGAQALGAAEPPRGRPQLSAREASPAPGVSAARGLGAVTTCGRGREVAGLMGRAGWGAAERGKRLGPLCERGAPFGHAPELETAGSRGGGAGYLVVVGGRAGRRGLAGGPRAPRRPC